MNQKIYGRYIVSDSEICHGKLTFRGTRIMVADVLEQVADGLDWETIIEEWRFSISKEAIAESISLSRQAFLEHADQYALESSVA
ncbi:MAG: DUF433 domain-containing protein [Desulfobacteraceae bacterium]|nr:DUF433 domain-containing protein [Desulfobacteraceae bacterium]MBC2720529.1 DUF433 domain-containing protein [Desulfobacteraceae bacterium]